MAEHVAVKIDGGVFVDDNLLIRIGITRQSKRTATGESSSNVTVYLDIAIVTDGSDSVFVAIFIIGRLCVGRLRGALGFRAIGSRVCCNDIFARVTLGLVTILVFGIPVVGVFYISRLT